MNPHIETIVNTVASLMDGDQLPDPKSAAAEKLISAIKGLQKSGTDADWGILGLKTNGLLIDRCHAHAVALGAILGSQE